MYPTEQQIKDLLKLPFPQASALAIEFSQKVTRDLKELNQKAKLLELVMIKLNKGNNENCTSTQNGS